MFQVPRNGFTLVETLISIFLILVVFLGVFGAFRFGLKIVGQSRARLTATALANQQIETARSLPYASLGVSGGFPDGSLEALKTATSNNIEYTISTRVDFVVDALDGLAPPEDDCPQDYKKIEVKVSWPGLLGGEVALVTDVAPENLAQECATGGGILLVSVFDAFGQMVSSPLIEVIDPMTEAIIKTATPAAGEHYFALAANTYKVQISKEGYSPDRSYGSDEIATPEKPHPIVLEGELTEVSFSIDKVSTLNVATLSPWGRGRFADSFGSETKLSQTSNVLVSNGEVVLARTNGDYQASGSLTSITITPTSFTSWEELSFSDEEPPGTAITYQLLYFADPDWLLIPDIDLPGNEAGLGLSPIDLSGLSPLTYPALRLRANLSTTVPAFTPALFDWQVSWITSEATPIPNVAFKLKGAKLIGLDEAEEPVYKYAQAHLSDSQGNVTISNLEWDNYTLSIDPVTGLDLTGTDPSPQPIALAPDTTLDVALYLAAENSLLITTQNIETTDPIFAASVRLFNAALGYDLTQETDEQGQTYFIPLQNAVYNIEVQAPGYTNYAGPVSISGDVTTTISLQQIE